MKALVPLFENLDDLVLSRERVGLQPESLEQLADFRFVHEPLNRRFRLRVLGLQGRLLDFVQQTRVRNERRLLQVG